MRLGSRLLAVAALAAAIPAAAYANDAIEDAIEARQGFYKLVSANAGPLFGMAKGDVEYDAEKAKGFADNLAALASMNNGALWPQGSDKESMPGKTRALPVTWETYPAVLEKQEAWVAAVNDVAAVAGDGLDALRGKMGALGGSCKGCHDTYRAKDF